MDEFAEFDPKVNDAFRFADCKMFLAYKDGKIAGRVAGIWHFLSFVSRAKSTACKTYILRIIYYQQRVR